MEQRFANCLPAICIYKPEGRIPCELESMKIEGQADGAVACFTITQIFQNSSPDPVDIRYLFPTSMRSCLYDTEFQVGTEVIKPKVHAKEEAKEEFAQAKDEGHTAIMGEILVPGLAEFQVGNVPSSTECRVSVKMIQTARITGPTEAMIKFPLQMLGGSREIRNVNQIVKGKFELTFDGQTFSSVPPGNDISLKMAIDGTHSTGFHNGRYSAITVVNNTGDDIEVKGDFIFVIDCSGSMSGAPIKQCREALTLFLKSLPETCKFNIVRFGSSFETLFRDGAVPYNDENLKTALVLAENLNANLGGTQLYQPLNSILQNTKGNTTQIFVLTDGQISDTERVISTVASFRNTARIFTMGIGSGADSRLVEGIAEATLGRSDFAMDNADIVDKVMGQLESALVPARKFELHGEIGGVAPFPLPPSFAGVPITVLAETSESTVLIVSDDGQEEVIELSASPLDEAAIKALYSFELIRDLERQELVKKEKGEDVKPIVDRIVKLSVESGVLSRHTAFIGVSEQPNVPPPQPQMFAARHMKMKRCAAPMAMAMAAPMPMAAAMPMSACKKMKAPMGMEMLGCMGASGGGGAPPPPPPPGCCPPPPMCDAAPPPTRCPPPGRGGRAAPKCKEATQSAPVPQPIVMQIVGLQEVNGSWKTLSTIEQIGNVKVDIAEGTEEVKATLLAIAVLMSKCAADQRKWALLVKKAKAWLRKALPDTDIDALVQTVISKL